MEERRLPGGRARQEVLLIQTSRRAAGAALGAILALAAALRLWRLDQNGHDNEYYAAAVRSMAASLHAFLYNSFDPAGFVSVDKPPLALWIQVASVKLFGFHGLSLLLPQALEGVASVWLIHHLVRRACGAPAGLLAGLFMALMPVSVAVDRSGNTESCLVLVLLLAAWALLRAAEGGSRRHLLLAMALIGVGFNVKMLAAFVVLPALVLVYAVGAPGRWPRRIADLALGAVVLLAVASPWVIAYDLTPPDRRPFVGSSRQNSMVELAVGHNGVGRFIRLAGAPRPGGDDQAPRVASARVATGAPASGAARLFVRVPAGPLRLADGQLAGQVGWLLPLAIMGLVAGALGGQLRRPLTSAHLLVGLLAGWALTYAVVYSYAGGIFHFYYLSTMSAPLAGLAGIGLVWLSRVRGEPGGRWLLLPAALVLAAVWQLGVEVHALGWRAGERLTPALFPAADDWLAWLHGAPVVGTLAAVAGLLALGPADDRAARGVSVGLLGVGLAGLLAIPAAWALSSVLVRGVPVLPSADVARLTRDFISADAQGRARAATVAPLVEFLRANRQGERYLLATSSTRLAAPIIIETGEPVAAMGGFHGLDPILTPASLASLVGAKQLRYVVLGDLSPVSRRLGGEAALRPVADWVRSSGSLVDPARWDPEGRRGAGRAGEVQLYDLRPGGAAPAGPPRPDATR